jgi:hypothetical protein
MLRASRRQVKAFRLGKRLPVGSFADAAVRGVGFRLQGAEISGAYDHGENKKERHKQTENDIGRALPTAAFFLLGLGGFRSR